MYLDIERKSFSEPIFVPGLFKIWVEKLSRQLEKFLENKYVFFSIL